MSPNDTHVIVGLSGGVDSAVAALLLKRRGYRVSGLFMKNWEEDDTEHYCAAAEDLEMARAVCARLDIPLDTVNFAAEYWDRVFSHFLAELAAGRTPNPDVLCNQEIKFKAFREHAERLGAAFIATGHYARVIERDGRFWLAKASDANKDQSYFLHTLDQRALARTLFPLGELDKPAVRALARDAGLPNHARQDSTGICFIGERRFRDFLGRYLPAQPGAILSLDGQRRGEHAGLMYYTIGQRQGLGIGGAGEAWYVVDKDVGRNLLWVAQGHDHPALFRRALTAGPLHWIGGEAPVAPGRLTAKTRYRQADQPCTLVGIRDGIGRVEFDSPQRAITPGQSVVFYDGELCLGGGVIAGAEPATGDVAMRTALST
jgi:tRNA-specific 2-thiouridylase